MAAVPRQTLTGLTNYRLGVSLEIAAAAGALLSVLPPVAAMQYALGGSAVILDGGRSAHA